VIQPTGKSFGVLYSTAAEWRAGRIVEECLFWDNDTFLAQIGLARQISRPLREEVLSAGSQAAGVPYQDARVRV